MALNPPGRAKKRPPTKLVAGIGTYDPRILCVRDEPHLLRLYTLWTCMLTRTTQRVIDRYPSYAGTTVAPTFRLFHEFADWVVNQVGWDREKVHLDKDLLCRGNRIYAPETCVFVPPAINQLLTTRANHRGKLPIGVRQSCHGRGYEASVKVGSVRKYLGAFLTPEEAFAAYKVAKEENIKRVANFYRSEIDARAYDALINRQVFITD